MKKVVCGCPVGTVLLIVLSVSLLPLVLFISGNNTSKANPETNILSAPGHDILRCLLVTCNRIAGLPYYEERDHKVRQEKAPDVYCYWSFYCRGRDIRSASLSVRRNLLVARLGSRPPRCSSKCGKCKPCKPVHVTVPPGNPVTAEYYPVTWRCKCGNRLFLP